MQQENTNKNSTIFCAGNHKYENYATTSKEHTEIYKFVKQQNNIFCAKNTPGYSSLFNRKMKRIRLEYSSLFNG